MYDLLTIVKTRAILDPHPTFPDLPHGAIGYQDRHTPVLALEVPAGADLIEAVATAQIQAKDPTARPPAVLTDFRLPGTFGSCFVNVQMQLQDVPPAVCSRPPGELLSVWSGENELAPNVRPYWQAMRFGTAEVPADGKRRWVALYVSPRSAGCKAPQHLWLAGSSSYHLMTLNVYRKRSEA